MKKLISLVVFFWLGPALAIPVTWTLDGAAFNDGASLNGSFVYDADTNTYSSILIEAEASPNQSSPQDALFSFDLLYSSANSYDSFSGNNVGLEGVNNNLLSCSFTFCERDFNLVYVSSLTNGGGIIGLDSASGERSATSGFTAERYLISGSLVGVAAVPVPAAVWLFSSALAGLGWLGRKHAV